MSVVNVCFMGEGAAVYEGALPVYATSGSIGLDLRACLGADFPSDATGRYADIPANGRVAVPAGLAVAPVEPVNPANSTNPTGAAYTLGGFVYSRSGLGAKQGVTVAQGVGVIDPDYRGEIIVMLLNTSAATHRIRQGDRMAQLVFQPVARPVLHAVTALDATERGAGGFGHTGRG